MQDKVTPLEARAALDVVDRGRRRVIDEIDLPGWYWWGLALGWNLSVRAEIAGRHTGRLVVIAVAALGAVTVAGALAAHADGAQHPVTIASSFVAVTIIRGGPRLMAVIRRRAAAAAAAA